MPEARLVPDPKLIRPLVSYGALLVPALVSFYVMTVADKFMIRALTDSPLEQVGLYSVGERIAGVMAEQGREMSHWLSTMFPGVLIYTAFLGYYPAIADEALPANFVLGQLDH